MVTVGALAAIAGRCVDNCSNTQTLALSAVIGAVTGGLDEGALIGIPEATRLSATEQATAARLIADREYTGGKLSESPVSDYDYVDQYRRTYDAIGNPDGFSSEHWNQGQFLSALDGHVFRKQGLNFTVLDVTGANSSQLDAIFSHIDQMPQSAQKSIIIVGDVSY